MSETAAPPPGSTGGKTIEDLRDHLFAAIQGVRDGTLTIERAQTVSQLAQVVVNTAKVEVEFMGAAKRTESRFLAGLPAPGGGGAGSVPGAPPAAPLPNGIVGVRRHLLKDD